MSNNRKYKKGQSFDGWALKSLLGKGGNGEVWLAEKDHDIKAIKLLKFNHKSTYARFSSEIKIISENQDIEGVIPVLQYHLPEYSKPSVPWFVMSVGKKFHEWKKKKTIIEIVEGFLDLAKTISELHSRKISHRDIKPANILYINDRLYLSDFGLVKYPESKDLTAKREDVGPKFTMAPEMRRTASEANGLPADVYSFAKTLWIGITEDYLCFDGQYNPFSSISINNHCSGLYTKSLNDLLVECTDNSPAQRPTMNDVIARLESWLEINNDFHDKNLTEWFDLQNKLFPAGSPSSVTWNAIDDIVTVMNEIAQVKSLNHMFYPDGGGNTFIHVEKANEPDFIAIKVSEKMYVLVSPEKLTFESFGVDPKWNYFRLELKGVNKSGIYDETGDGFYDEELVEISPNQYIKRYHWDEGEYNGRPLPEESNLISRYSRKGSFVIFSTRSPYNLNSSTYDARHNKHSESDFREYIERNAVRAKKRQQVSNLLNT